MVQTYFALLSARSYPDAWRLWANEGRASGLSAAAFAESFRGYRRYAANVGAPGAPEGAAGSVYVEVPVQVYGRKVDGREFSFLGTMRLRRSNDVPGASEQQRRWRIERFEAARAS